MGRDFKKNKVKVDLASYPLYLVQGVPKVGKTTLMYDLAQYVYGDVDKMLLISFKDEEGYNHLDGVLVEQLNYWSKVPKKALKVNPDEISFTNLVDDIIENNHEYGFKMITFDTFDKLVELGIDEVKRLHQEQKGTPCKSLNDALGGYGKGRDKLLELMLEPINKLRKAGIAIFILAHTKYKQKMDDSTGTEYDQLTNSLRHDFYACYSNIAQMIVTIDIERSIVDGKQTGERRMMHFRSNGTVDCGCRFKEVPDKLDLSAENFMLAFETGVKSNMKKDVTDKDIEKIRREEIQEMERVAGIEKEFIVDEKKNGELLKTIQSLFISAEDNKKNKAKALVKEYGLSGFTDTNFPTKHIENILSALQ